MKKHILIICLLLSSATVFAQFQRGGRNGRMNMGAPQNTEPTDSQKKQMERKAEERKDEYIATFLTTLEADEFQKEILKQNLNSYFVKLKDFRKTTFDGSLEQKDALDKMRKEHFAELKELISENDMQKLNDMLDGKFEENKAKKKKRRKRRKNKD